MRTPINILIGEDSLLQAFENTSIKFAEGSFCNTIDINIKDADLWEAFNPITNFGLVILKVKIGDLDYEFMTEERSTSVNLPGISFSVWGRSAQALLDKPYSKTVNDTEDKIHPWQLDDTTAEEIITYVVDYCCSSYIKSKTHVHWEVEDFLVYKDTFSTSNNSPIEVISQLAGIIGAELVANPDGSLTVQEYSVEEDEAVQEYDDIDHIVALSDDIAYPIGYNAVTVEGANTNKDNASAYLSVELREDDLPGWLYDAERIVRAYYYHPKNLGLACAIVRGGIRALAGNYERFQEWVLLVWGTGNTSYPDLHGNSTITGNENIPLLFVYADYHCRYQDFGVTSHLVESDVPKYGVASWYFTDRSNTTTMTFEYYDASHGEDDLVLQLDWQSDTILTSIAVNPTDELAYFWRPGMEMNADVIKRSAVYSPNITTSPSGSPTAGIAYIHVDRNASEMAKFRVWGLFWVLAKRWFDSVYAGGSFSLLNYPPPDTRYTPIVEELCFSGGEATLSRPFYTNGSVIWLTPGGNPLLFKYGSTRVTMSGYSESMPFAIGTVSYITCYIDRETIVPKSYKAKDFYVHLERRPVIGVTDDTVRPEYLSISKAVDNQDIPTTVVGTATKDIAIEVKDFATEVVVPGATVWIDNSWRGVTDVNGLLALKGIAVGDHQIRITASGYLDSDEDELANDTFTVAADATDPSGQVIP